MSSDSVDSAAISNAEKVLGKFNIDVYDKQTGAFRGLETVLGDLNKRWDTLHDDEKSKYCSDAQ